MAPSEALSGQFDLQDVDNSLDARTDEANKLHTHAFVVGDFGLLLPPDSVAEVTGDLTVCRLPNTPEFLLGMVNLRGNIVPVFDMFSLLGVEKNESGDSRQLIVRIDEEWVGVDIQELPTRIMLENDEKLTQYPALPAALQPWVQTCYRKDRLWVEWDLKGFFASLAKRM